MRCAFQVRNAPFSRVSYNIANRAAQSNSVYINVLKIPIVLADAVSKWLCLELSKEKLI